MRARSPSTDSLAYGEVVPMPMFPLESVVPVPSTPVPKIRFPMLSWLSAVFDGASTS